jgi:hypothetical protein
MNTSKINVGTGAPARSGGAKLRGAPTLSHLCHSERSEESLSNRRIWLVLAIFLLLTIPLLAQPKPRIDFEKLLQQFPDLPWEFEIRYVIHDGPRTDMLRLYNDERADLVRWRPEDPGSLAEVCHSTLEEKQLRHLLETMRDRNFNDLPSDSEMLRTIAETGDATVSVRVGRTTLRKIDRHERDNPGLAAVEKELDSALKFVATDPETKCGMESVPAKP